MARQLLLSTIESPIFGVNRGLGSRIGRVGRCLGHLLRDMRRVIGRTQEEVVAREKSPKLPLALMVAWVFVSQAAFVGMSQAEAQMAFFRPAPKSTVAPPGAQGARDSVAAPASGHVARRAIELSEIYDPANPAHNFLQPYREATRNLPHDAVGFPDWMRALREGAINPRAGMSGKESMDILDLDIVMRNTKGMPNVRFPHNSHTMWLSCGNCHPVPFIPVAGANQIRMADIFRGQFCGMCHDRVAFVTFFSCDRCHSVPQGASGNR